MLNQQLIDTMMLHVRMPDQNRGDLNAQIAAVNTGEAKMHEMIRKFGVETVRSGSWTWARPAPAPSSAIWPDGDFRFVDYLDEDGPGGVPVRLDLTLKVRGDRAVMDFTGSDPDRLPVGAAGGGGIVNVKTFDAASGKLSMASIDPVTGGAGGSALGDGTDGSGANSSFLKNTPVENNEIEVPIKFRRYGLVPDSGGPGTARGGMATELEVEVFTPDTVITARNRDRTIFAARGGAGGQPGAPSLFTRYTPKGERIDLGNSDVVNMGPGDVFNLTSGGGAGYGDPFARPVALVVRDVLRGSVTPDAARAQYGVVVTRDGVLDSDATQALREAHVAPAPETYSYNASRRAYKAIWTDANYAALTRALAAMPVHWRHFVKREVFDQIHAMPGADRKGDGSDVRAAVDAVLARVPGLARSMQMPEAAE